MEHICTCSQTACRLHPNNHNLGCTPCIKKNLKTKEMPSCFFNLIEDSENRPGDSFEDFAHLILKNKP